MGFLKKLFYRNQPNRDTEYEESNFDNLVIGRTKLNMSDPAVREQYVRNCLEELRETNKEMDRLEAEYADVTGLLTDMEEIEGLPDSKRKEIEDYARAIKELRSAHDAYVRKETLLSEHDYKRMESMEDDVIDGMKKIEEEEDYKSKVKKDLSKVGKERNAYEFRYNQLSNAIDNTRGISTIIIVSTIVLVIVLLVLQLVLSLDVKLGYYATIAIVALSLTILYVKYVDYTREKRRVFNTINELILLENKVKIRYVNNKNLLDYLYTKFEVNSLDELKDLYSRYEKEREERRRFERNEAASEENLERLMKCLRRLNIKDPDIWIHQTDALCDSREMVEIRHGLIGRRQKLRKQMEYNEGIALEAKDEIRDVIRDYPEASESILQLVESYENK